MAVQPVPLYARPRVRRVLRLAAVLGVVLGVETTILHLATDPMADVRAYYDAGARLNAGQPLYSQALPSDQPTIYWYPPLLAILFRPLAALPFEWAAAIWMAIVIGTTILAFWRLGLGEPVLLVAAWLALPMMWAVVIGQAQPLVTLLLSIGAPWSVAVAANLKVFPILVAVYWLGRREWRQIATLAGWMAGLLVIQVALEPSGTLAYIGFLNLEQVGEVNNVSPYAISPLLWVVTVGILVFASIRLAHTRFGWPLAVALVVFAAPRLLVYQLSTLLAGLGGPRKGRDRSGTT